MVELVKLSKKYFSAFEKLNALRLDFNELNEDFLSVYHNCSFAQQIMLKNRVRLLKYNYNIIGYLWYTVLDKNTCIINSMYVDNKDLVKEDIKYFYEMLIKQLRRKYYIRYYCECNNANFEVLDKLGFNKCDGIIDMKCEINDIIGYTSKNIIEFEVLKKGTQEDLRCKIQNEVFKNDSRMPLGIEDIYFDELQNYYFDQGAIFIKLDNKYIGYGQVIIDDNYAIIVNVGILNEYRGRGYGKDLLYHLIGIIKDNGYKEVSIRVASNNLIALNLYKSIGFTAYKESYNWILKRSR